MAVRSEGSSQQAIAQRRLSNTFSALRNRNYRLFWYGQFVSQSGAWMQRVAQAWLVLQLTDSPMALGTITALQFTPILLLSLVGGVIADRFPKRRLLIVTQAIMATQAVIMATLATTGQLQLWHIYVLAAVLGTANALDNPARQSFVSEMVGTKDLYNAIALNSSLFNTARIAGPALGGATVALAGVVFCFWLNAFSFLATIAALLAMRTEELHDVQPPNRDRVATQLREGLSYALGTREVCVIIIALGFVGCFGFNFSVVIPLIGRFVLDSGPFEFGVLFSSQGIGSIAAALTIASRRPAGERAFLLGGAAFCLLLLLVAMSRSFWLSSLLLAGCGAASSVFSTTANTRLQLTTPPALRGRVMGIYALVMMGTTPFGSTALGTLSEAFGVQVALAICDGLCWIGLLSAFLYARRQPARASLPLAASQAER